MKQEQIQKQHKTRESDPVAEIPDTTEVQEKGESLIEDLDALLDEIDDVLEENAEEFVTAYVQYNGQ